MGGNTKQGWRGCHRYLHRGDESWPEQARTLFAAADQLWTNSTLRPDQYAQPVLALIALRQMEAKFEAVHAELAPQYKGRLKPAPADYQAKGAIFLPENSRFSRLLALPGTADLGAELNAAMKGSRGNCGHLASLHKHLSRRQQSSYLGWAVPPPANGRAGRCAL